MERGLGAGMELSILSELHRERDARILTRLRSEVFQFFLSCIYPRFLG